MKEKLILDYLKSKNLKTYKGCDNLENIIVSGDSITITEVSSCGHYKDTFSLDLLDVLGWMYGRLDSLN